MGKILDAFKAYAKWATSDFTGNYEIKAYDSTTGEGIQSHLDDFRKKTGVAVGSLETAIDENTTKLNSLTSKDHAENIGDIGRFYCKHKVVSVILNIGGGTHEFNSNDTIGTISDGWRPVVETYFVAHTGVPGKSPISLVVQPNGIIKTRHDIRHSDGNYIGSVCYPIS